MYLSFCFIYKYKNIFLNVNILLFRYPIMSDFLWPLWSAAYWPSCPSPSPGVCPNSCPLSWWFHPTISFSVTPFSSCSQSFPVSGCFPMSWLFPSTGGQSIRASVLVSFPLGLIGLISLQSKGLLRVFSSTTVQKCQFFNAQTSLWSNSEGRGRAVVGSLHTSPG